jgi:hypothetical protein
MSSRYEVIIKKTLPGEIVALCVAAIISGSLFLPSEVSGQNSRNLGLGRAISYEILTRLANPKDSEFRVGVVNVAAEFGALISPQGQSPVAEYFRGFSGARDSTWQLSWTAMELLDSSEELRFEVIRKTIESRLCPELEEVASRFFAELERALDSEISLSELPHQRALETITVDGTWYVIQIWTGERTLAIHPDRDIDKSLDAASGSLLRTVGGCANGVPGTVEVHSRW